MPPSSEGDASCVDVPPDDDPPELEAPEPEAPDPEPPEPEPPPPALVPEHAAATRQSVGKAARAIVNISMTALHATSSARSATDAGE